MKLGFIHPIPKTRLVHWWCWCNKKGWMGSSQDYYVDVLISIRVMVPKTIFYFVVLSFIERFFGRSFDVMISLFLRLCESLGISIMFVVLILNGGEWCKLWNMGGNTITKGMVRFEAKHIGQFCVDFVSQNLHSESSKHFEIVMKG